MREIEQNGADIQNRSMSFTIAQVELIMLEGARSRERDKRKLYLILDIKDLNANNNSLLSI